MHSRLPLIRLARRRLVGGRARASRPAAGLLAAAVAALALAPGAEARPPAKPVAYKAANEAGADLAGCVNAQNVIVRDCRETGPGRQTCDLNVFDDDYDEGGFDCYWEVRVEQARRGIRGRSRQTECHGAQGRHGSRSRGGARRRGRSPRQERSPRGRSRASART